MQCCHLTHTHTHTHRHNHFTALVTLSGTTQTSWYQKVHFAIFWIFWCKMKITRAYAPTIRMDCHPIQTNWCPISAIPPLLRQMPFVTNLPDIIKLTPVRLCHILSVNLPRWWNCGRGSSSPVVTSGDLARVPVP